jgi:hypothetical protein
MGRRLAGVLFAVLALAGCRDGERPTSDPHDTIPADAKVPARARAFVDGMPEPGAVSFRATYRVLQKLGAVDSEVHVTSGGGRWTIDVGDVHVDSAAGPMPEARLTPYGVTSTFFASAAARRLETASKRSGAVVEATARTEAGVELHCLVVGIGGVALTTTCTTAEGVVGYEDDASRTVVLTAYELG